MANNWGGTNLYLKSVKVTESKNNVSEVDLLPSTLSNQGNTSALMGAGYRHMKVSVSGFCSTTDLNVLISDNKSETAKNLEIFIGTVKQIDDNFVITNLDYEIHFADDYAYYNIEFIQA